MDWIELSKKLPKDRQSVRVKTSNNTECSCIFRLNGKLFGFFKPPSAKHIYDNVVRDVTHWKIIDPDDEDYED